MSGVITDSSGAPVPGAVLVLDGQPLDAALEADGSFTITISGGARTLTASVDEGTLWRVEFDAVARELTKLPPLTPDPEFYVDGRDWHEDSDGDGFIGAAAISSRVRPSAEHVDVAVSDEPFDCDDTRREVHPDALDVCADAIDQDCDGEDAPCVAQLLSEDTEADAQLPRWGYCNPAPRRLARNARGDLLATWAIETGTGAKSMMSIKPAGSDDWQDAIVLGTIAPDLIYGNIKIEGQIAASNGTGFMVVWSSNHSHTEAVEVEPNGHGGWTFERHDLGYVYLDRAHLDATETGYTLISQSGTSAQVHDFDDGALSAPVDLELASLELIDWSSATDGETHLIVASSPNYEPGSPGAELRFLLRSDGDWSEIGRHSIPADARFYFGSRLAASRGPGGYAVAWSSDAGISGVVRLVQAPQGVWSIDVGPELVLPEGEPLYSAHIASDGSGYRALWVPLYDAPLQTAQMRFDDGAWITVDAPLSPGLAERTSCVRLTSRENGYELVIDARDGAHTYVPGADRWQQASHLMQLPNNSAPGYTHLFADDLHFAAWENLGKVYVASRSGEGVWTSGQQVSAGDHVGSAVSPKLTRRADGTILAAWAQKTQIAARVSARVLEEGAWSDIIDVHQRTDYALSGAVIAASPSGADFVLLGDGGQFSTSTARVTGGGGEPWVSVTGEAPVIRRSSDLPKLVSNGETVLAAFADWRSLYTGTHNGLVWSEPARHPAADVRQITSLEAASNGSGFAISYGGRDDVTIHLLEGDVWAEPIVDSGPLRIIAIARSGDGYALTWIRHDGSSERYDVSAAFIRDGALLPPIKIAAVGRARTRIGGMASGREGAVAVSWLQARPDGAHDVRVAVSDGVSWAPAETVASIWPSAPYPPPSAPKLAYCGNRLAAVWISQSRDSSPLMWALRSDDGTWSAPRETTRPDAEVTQFDVVGGPIACAGIWAEVAVEDETVTRIFVDLDL